MTILYAIVAKPGDPSKILAEYAQTTGNFKQVTATILAKINARDRKESLVSTLPAHREFTQCLRVVSVHMPCAVMMNYLISLF